MPCICSILHESAVVLDACELSLFSNAADMSCRGSDDEEECPGSPSADAELFKLSLPVQVTAAPNVSFTLLQCFILSPLCMKQLLCRKLRRRQLQHAATEVSPQFVLQLQQHPAQQQCTVVG